MENNTAPTTENNLQNSQVILARQYQGPMPPPEILEGYEHIHPGAADMLFREHEANSKALREIYTKEKLARLEKDKRGQYLAFTVIFLMLLLVFAGMLMNQPIISGGMAVVAAFSAAKAFLPKK